VENVLVSGRNSPFEGFPYLFGAFTCLQNIYILYVYIHLMQFIFRSEVFAIVDTVSLHGTGESEVFIIGLIQTGDLVTSGWASIHKTVKQIENN